MLVDHATMKRWDKRKELSNLYALISQFFDSIDARDIVCGRVSSEILENFLVVKNEFARKQHDFWDLREFNRLLGDKLFVAIFEMTPHAYEDKLKKLNTEKTQTQTTIEVENKQKSDIQTSEEIVDNQKSEKNNNDEVGSDVSEQKALDDFTEERAKQKLSDAKEREYIIFEVITDDKGNKHIVPLNSDEYNIKRKSK